MIKRTLSILVATTLIIGCAPKVRPAPRPRIISYSPAVTDILYDLGLGEHIVGVANYSILPDGENKPIVGDVSNPNSEFILSLQPDIILHQSSPQTTQFDSIKRHLPELKVVSVMTDSVPGVLDSIRTIAEVSGVKDRGEELAAKIKARLDALEQKCKDLPRPRVLFVMGYDHPGTAGGKTYLDDIITLAGGVNVARDMDRYPQINAEWVLQAKPDVIICQIDKPSEVDAARRYWLSLAGVPAAQSGRVYVTADPRITIYGSRLADVAEQFGAWIHGESAGSVTASGPAEGVKP